MLKSSGCLRDNVIIGELHHLHDHISIKDGRYNAGKQLTGILNEAIVNLKSLVAAESA